MWITLDNDKNLSLLAKHSFEVHLGVVINKCQIDKNKINTKQLNL